MSLKYDLVHELLTLSNNISSTTDYYEFDVRGVGKIQSSISRSSSSSPSKIFVAFGSDYKSLSLLSRKVYLKNGKKKFKGKVSKVGRIKTKKEIQKIEERIRDEMLNKPDKVWVSKLVHDILHKSELFEKLLIEIMDHPITHEIYVTGYGFGGALATLFGYQLSFILPNQQVSVVSFGSPKIGNASWKESFNRKKNLIHYRFVNRCDPVPSFPLLDYHTGSCIVLGKKKVELIDYSMDAHNAYEYMSHLYKINPSIVFFNKT